MRWTKAGQLCGAVLLTCLAAFWHSMLWGEVSTASSSSSSARLLVSLLRAALPSFSLDRLPLPLPLLSAVLVLAGKCRTLGWNRGVRAELVAVAEDFARPFRVALAAAAVRAEEVDPKHVFQDFVLALCRCSSYTFAYGPLSSIILAATADPLFLVRGIVRDLQALDEDGGGWFRSVHLLWIALAFAFSHVLHMAVITGLLHYYFSHGVRRFQRLARLRRKRRTAAGRLGPAAVDWPHWAGRLEKALLAVVSCGAHQRGPLWWASIHRRHHENCDLPNSTLDPHSPAVDGWYYAHVGWLGDRANFEIQAKYIQRDLLEEEAAAAAAASASASASASATATETKKMAAAAKQARRFCPEMLLIELFCFRIAAFLSVHGVLEPMIQLASRGNLLLGDAWMPLELITPMTEALLLGRATAWHASFWVNSYCHHPDHDTLEGGTKEQKSPPSSSGTSKRNGNGKSSNFCVARHLPYRWLAAYSLGETWRHDRHHKTYPPGAKWWLQ